MSTCRLQGQNESINVTQMKAGEIAQIISWSSSTAYVCLFVQRCDKYLFAFGSAGIWWDDISWGLNTQSSSKEWDKCMVRILDETEVLELRNEKSSK